MGSEKKTIRKVEQHEKTETRIEPEVVEEEIEVAVCDFCGMAFEDIQPEELNELYFNPQKEHTEKVLISDGFQKNRKLARAIDMSNIIDFNMKSVVEIMEEDQIEAKSIMNADSVSDADFGGFKFQKSGDMAYFFTIELPEVKSEASMEVCDNCKEGILEGSE